MAVTATLYNGAAKKLANKEYDFTGLKVMLLDAEYTFSAAHVGLDQVLTGASPDAEFYGNGWTQGGETLTNVTVSTVTTNDAKLDADDVSVTASGGDIGPVTQAIIYDATSSPTDLLLHIAFGQAETAGVGTPFQFQWDADGIITFTVS